MGAAWRQASTEAAEVFARADRLLGSRLGLPLSELCTSGPAERLNQTDASQPAIYTASVACWRALLARRGLADHDGPATATAGLSLGEYTALHVAGSLSFEDGLELVTLRGRAMQDAATSPEAMSGGGGSMLALIGATDAQAQEVCDRARGPYVLVCANFNAPGQVVLSGHKAACDAAAKVAEAMGLKSAPLAVAGAFHSPLMAPAAERLGAALAGTNIRPPRCPVISNVTAQPHTMSTASSVGGKIRELLVQQLTHPVRWAQSCNLLTQQHPALAVGAPGGSETEYLELAPGKTLAGLMRRIDKTIKVTTNDTP